jgi:dTDP-4-amino-4,6-dideoxygalactose transaminase
VVIAVPLVDLAAQEAPIREEVLAEIARIGVGGHFILGPSVARFEQWLAAACGVRCAVGVASGTDALELGLRALGIGPGDGVVTPAFAFVAAAEAIAATGARPVFCDVEEETLCASARTMSVAVDRGRQLGLAVKALLPVHLFGACARLGEIETLAKRERLALVEDAAQALGARDSAGLVAGGVGTVGCFSFFPTKPLGAWGDGGAVVTDDEGVAEHVRRLRAHGATAPYVHHETGRNSRLDALQAAVLSVKTRHLAAWQKARADVAAQYEAGLRGLPLVLVPVPRPPSVHAWHAFVVRVDGRRDSLAAWLERRGVETRVYYPMPLHRQPCFRHLGEPPCPNAERACRTALALPMSAAVTPAQAGLVIRAIRSFFEA